MRRTPIFAVAMLLLAATAMSAHAVTITVTNTNDSGPGSLRQALASANNGDTISFAVTGSIVLSSDGLVVARNVTISGPGTNQLTIDGNQATFVVGVIPQKTVSISGLSITNGGYGIWNQQGTLSVNNCVLSGNSSAGLYNDGEDPNGASVTVTNSIISNNSGIGADNVSVSSSAVCACMTITGSVVSNNAENGISNVASGGTFPSGEAGLTVVNSDISDNGGSGIGNSATNTGVGATIVNTTVSGNSAGGIFTSAGPKSGARVTVTESTISGNSTFGGIYGASIVNLTVTNSTISGNSSADNGGGINFPDATIVKSTISGNSAETSGGGIYGTGATIENSTISGNSAGTSGGGIYDNSGSILSIKNSTISGNSAGTSGGGIYEFSSSLTISDTILNAGASGENIFNDGGTVTSEGYNLSSDDGGGYLTGPGDQINTDPLLGPLQNNGGPTFTHALLVGSPAIDAGDPNFVPPPSTDQRGCPFDRVSNGRIDIGSFETQPPLRRSDPCQRPRPTPAPRP